MLKNSELNCYNEKSNLLNDKTFEGKKFRCKGKVKD